ncbi:YdaS family helix-turn-helix protein [Nitratireductor aquimarinus]|uniref:YdaS family helix-turn-helix protein n=1 Tax=Nitratireductor aquimarinus TaxID=889300 RepID=UPI002936CE0D|nr:YdaS family helix-turn-helix protein [Nitratireductor aquimarinus]MDV2966396.1 YdaS family helix-turn-helix protein [Nitratireductor aquimarinus]
MLKIVEQAAEKVGGLSKLAAELGIKHQAFYSWRQVPPARVLDLERISGVSRHHIRPDIYGEPLTSGTDRAPEAAE